MTDEETRRWYALALRHLRAARYLLRRGLHDVSVFHSCHAFECGVCAAIAALGCDVPPKGKKHRKTSTGRQYFYTLPSGSVVSQNSLHAARFAVFAEMVDTNGELYLKFGTLRPHLETSARNNALYYDQILNRSPHEAYGEAESMGYLSDVTRFVKSVRQTGRF